MNSLAAVHLRQARAFLRAGQPQRAIELLEKARALARDDQQMLLEIVEALAMAYQEAGSPEKAARCLTQLRGISGRNAKGPANTSGFGHRKRIRIRWLATAITAVIVLGVAIFFVTRKTKPAPLTSVAPATMPVTQPAVPSVIVATPHPRAATTRTTEISTAVKREQVRQCVALLVLLGHYEGLANGNHLEVFLPLSSAAAFVVKPNGILLTVRHLTHLLKENNFPSTLQSLKLSTVTLRDIRCVVCFSADANDWVDAKLLYESDQYDVAVLSTDRHFPAALDCSGRDAVRGEILDAWRYPGVLTFDSHYMDAAKVDQMIQSLPQTHSANLLAAVTPECFVASKISGAVSVAELNVDGGECVELAAKPAGDNGGGPIVDGLGHAIAIAEPGKDKAVRVVGILVNQLQDEIAPYVMPVRAAAKILSSSNGTQLTNTDQN